MADPGCRSVDFIRIRQTRIVAIQSAEDVAEAPEHLAAESPAQRQFHGVVHTLWLRHGEDPACSSAGLSAPHVPSIVAPKPFTRIDLRIMLVAVDQDADIFHRAAKTVVNIVCAEYCAWPNLNLGSGVCQIRTHWLDIRVDSFGTEARNAAVAEPAGCSFQRFRPGNPLGDKTRKIQRVQAAIVRAPVIAAEGAARQLIFHPIEVTAPTSRRS